MMFTEKKPLYIIIITFSIILVLLLVFMLAAIGNNKDLVDFFIIHILIVSTCLLLFYRFRIQVKKEKLILSFGIGWIKKEILLNDVDLESFNEKKIPWFYGVGWRTDFKGNVLFNATSGTALTFRLKNQPKKIMIVTKQRELLKNALMHSRAQ